MRPRRHWKEWDQPWLALIPALITFGVTLYQIGRPTLWQDEISTLSDISRSLPQMFHLLGHIDAVHAAYYVIMWVVVKAIGTSTVALRLPSAVAMGVAAGGITLLGRRLVSVWAGLAAGLVFAAIPDVSWYGQDAREIAFVTALATVASYLLVRVVDAGPGERRGWLIAYGAALALLGLVNLFALLLIPAHGVALGVISLRNRQAGTDASLRTAVWGWLAAAVIAILAASPVMVLGWQQRSQIAWLARPDVRSLPKIEKVIGPPGMVAAVLGILVIAVTVSILRGRPRLEKDWPLRLAALAVPWLFLPLALLLSASLVHPVFVTRYIIFCLPALALLMGAALAALGRVAGPVALILIVALALPAQGQARAVNGHGQNLRRISVLLADRAHPGDAVLFGNSYVRKIEIGYPEGFRSLRDISLGETALQAAQPVGTDASAAVIQQRLSTVTRLWVITISHHHYALPNAQHLGFSLARSWTVTGYDVRLFLRQGLVSG
jgi:mannosyltransferase